MEDKFNLWELEQLVKARDFRLRLIKATLDEIEKVLKARN